MLTSSNLFHRPEKVEAESLQEDQQSSSRLPATILVSLPTVNPMHKFHTTVQTVIDQSVKHCTHWDAKQAAKAFQHVAKYALNLVAFPWQCEFKTIRVSSGSIKVNQLS